jgi:hypothetical protein
MSLETHEMAQPPFGVDKIILQRLPRVAHAAQPWALWLNPLGGILSPERPEGKRADLTFNVNQTNCSMTPIYHYSLPFRASATTDRGATS